MKCACSLLLVLCAVQMMANDIEVTGTVVSLNDRPLGGVNIILKGTPYATASDMDGYFRLKASEGTAVFLFMFKGRKAVEHTVIIRPGFKYQIHVTLAAKAETFNQSHAVTSELPIHAPLISGLVKDQDNRLLQGVIVKDKTGGFTAKTNNEGHFTLSVPEGNNQLNFVFGAMKDLSITVNVQSGIHYFIDATLIEKKRKFRHRQSAAKISATPEQENR